MSRADFVRDFDKPLDSLALMYKNAWLHVCMYSVHSFWPNGYTDRSAILHTDVD